MTFADIIDQEYENQDTRIKEILSILDVSVDKLSSKGRQHLNFLAQVVDILGLRDADEASLMTAILDLQRANRQSDIKDRQMQAVLTRVQQQRKVRQSMITKLDQLLDELNSFDDMDAHLASDYTKHIEILGEKQKEYQQKYKEMSLALPEYAMDESLTLESLKKLDKEIVGQWKELEERRMELKGFQDLPPDLNLATLKLEEKKSELEELMNIKKELLDKISIS